MLITASALSILGVLSTHPTLEICSAAYFEYNTAATEINIDFEAPWSINAFGLLNEDICGARK